MDKVANLDFTGWTDADLRVLHRKIGEYLSIEDELNLEQELRKHYQKTNDAYDMMLASAMEGSTPNGLAAMGSAVTKVLSDITAVRIGIRTAEDYDLLLSTIIGVLEDMDTDDAKNALHHLETRLKANQ